MTTSSPAPLAPPGGARAPWLHPVDKVHLGFYGFVLLVTVLRVGALPEAWKSFAWYGGATVATLVVAAAVRGKTGMTPGLVRAAFTIGVAPFSFLMLAFVVPYANPWHQERLLYDVDTWAFLGRNPNVMLDGMATPWLTELLQAVYAFYYAIPLVMLVAMVLRRTAGGLERGLFDVLLCLYGSYVGYFLVPATGPNINKLGLYPAHFASPMEGLWFAEELRASIFAAEWIKQDCWPSGHTALSFVCLVIARREGVRWAYWTLLVPVILLIFSTMYLRYHYVVDVVCGFLLAFAVLRWGRPLEARLRGDTGPTGS
ncbi:MAG: phosphatase PAP2 family protein [Planctomycetia bacterium]|nr:phosphatase PAP2 family protein [Planctomycetia bacterium]